MSLEDGSEKKDLGIGKSENKNELGAKEFRSALSSVGFPGNTYDLTHQGSHTRRQEIFSIQFLFP